VGGQDILDPAMPVYIGNLSENRYLKLKVYNIRRYGKIVFFELSERRPVPIHESILGTGEFSIQK